MHYCHDQLYDFAFFSPAHSCCDPDSDRPCCSSEGMSSTNHCKDKSIAVETTDDYMVAGYTFNFETFHNTVFLLASATLYSYQDSENLAAKEAPWYKKPPPYTEVVLSQIQSFLI